MSVPQQGRARQLFRLIAYARPYLWVVGLAILFAWLYGAGLTGRAYLLGPLLDDVALPSAAISSWDDVLATKSEVDAASLAADREALRERIRENFLRLAFVGFSLVILMPFVRLVRDYSSDWLMTRLYVDLQTALGEKLLRLPLAHHISERRGDFIARLSSDTAVANRAQAVVFGGLLKDGAIVVTALSVAFVLNWQLALVTLLIAPPVAVVLRVFGHRIRKSSQARQERVSEVTQRLLQLLSGIKVIKAFHAEGRERDGLSRSLMRYFARSMRVVRNRVYSRSLIELVSQASFMAILLVGVYAVLEGLWELTLGQLTAFAFISAMIYRPTKSLGTMYNSIQDALPAAERVFDVLDAAEVPADPEGALPLARVEKGIRYRDVVFGYGRERVLCGLNLEISVGESVALVGRTGAGKTTAADLLLRFHEPASGRIEIDGFDIARIQRKSLLEKIAVVTQEPFLFDATILENIRYGNPDATFDEVKRAANTAHVDEFIDSLPLGYDTPVGELGSQLSGGQRQRLTIARAILSDPQILIFDEATSALDAKAEQRVQEAVSNLMRGRTVLLIAHRLSTVKSCDRIAVIEDGRISMTGSHEELLSRGGLYRELVELQLK